MTFDDDYTPTVPGFYSHRMWEWIENRFICARPQTLYSLAIGDLPPITAGPVCLHLDDCARCRATALQLWRERPKHG